MNTDADLLKKTINDHGFDSSNINIHKLSGLITFYDIAVEKSGMSWKCTDCDHHHVRNWHKYELLHTLNNVVSYSYIRFDSQLSYLNACHMPPAAIKFMRTKGHFNVITD